jgi:hypothetical protein
MRWCVILLAACSFHAYDAIDAAPGNVGHDSTVQPDVPAGSGWLSGYSFRKPITVTAGAVLDNFPVSVVEPFDASLASHAHGGADLAVTAADGVTPLPLDIVTFVQTNGGLEAWVEMTVDVSPVTAFLYYGSGDTPARTSPWAAYAGVWHMNGTVGETDSSAHGNDLTAQATLPAAAPGIVGAARAYNGSTDALTTAAPAPSALAFGSGSFTYELWVNAQPTPTRNPSPLWTGGSENAEAGYDFQLGSNVWGAEVVDTDTSLQFVSLGQPGAFDGAWTQLAAVLDRSDESSEVMTTYANGALATTASVTFGSTTGSDAFQIGRVGNTTEFQGAIDEVRVIGAVLPAAWFGAEYRNADPMTRASFVMVGSEETR